MKKMIALLMAMVLALASIPAYAAVPSKTTTDNTQVKQIETASDVVVAPEFAVKVAADPEPVVNEIAKVFSFVNEQQEAPVNYFPAETKEAIKEVLAVQGVAEVNDEVLESMELNEFITIQPVEYKEEYGDIKAHFTFVTQYAVGQKVVAMMSIYTGEVDENGEPIVEWVALEAEVQADGSLAVIIPQAEMLRMQEAEAVALAVLSEPASL